MLALVRLLLGSPPLQPTTSMHGWWEEYRSRVAGLPPIDRAIAGGFTADRAGYAFAAGYQAALHALVPSLPDGALASLCATEAGGAHPRAIQTTLSPEGEGRFRLDGHKHFATLASGDGVLLVVASTGMDAAGRNRLRLARVGARAPGIRMSPLPEPPFAPEIPHAEVWLEAVGLAGEDVLPGDGYERYLKPFRTIEDLHVHAALLAHLFGVASRFGWPQPVREQLLFLLAGLRALAHEPPDAPELHVALAGAISLSRRLIDETREPWERVDPQVRERWERDRPLMEVAGRARAQRREKAWQLLEAGDGGRRG